jgi:hypothetical protein
MLVTFLLIYTSQDIVFRHSFKLDAFLNGIWQVYFGKKFADASLLPSD